MVTSSCDVDVSAFAQPFKDDDQVFHKLPDHHKNGYLKQFRYLKLLVGELLMIDAQFKVYTLL